MASDQIYVWLFNLMTMNPARSRETVRLPDIAGRDSKLDTGVLEPCVVALGITEGMYAYASRQVIIV